MTNNGMKEKLSLLLDGEDSVEDSLNTWKVVDNNPEVREQLRRYNIIREAMLDSRAILPDRSFSDRISAAIAEEPTVLAPKRFADRIKMPERMVSRAIAASLAAVALLVGRSLHDYSPMKGADILTLSGVMGPGSDSSKENVDTEFRDYLVSHYETANLSGVQVMLPSVRLVSSDANR